MSLTKYTHQLFTWFANKQIIANHDKCYLLLNSHDDANIEITNVIIKTSLSKKLLGGFIDNKLQFDKHGESFKKQAEN